MPEIKDIMKTDVISVEKNTPVMEAIHKLVTHNFTGLPVVDKENHVVGILSEKDVLALAIRIHEKSYESNEKGMAVEDFMTKDAVSIDVNESLTAVFTCLMKNKFRRVPIVSERRLVGIISRKDVIEYIMNIKN